MTEREGRAVACSAEPPHGCPECARAARAAAAAEVDKDAEGPLVMTMGFILMALAGVFWLMFSLLLPSCSWDFSGDCWFGFPLLAILGLGIGPLVIVLGFWQWRRRRAEKGALAAEGGA